MNIHLRNFSHIISYWRVEDLKEIDFVYKTCPTNINQASIKIDKLHRFLICNDLEKAIISKVEQKRNIIGNYFDVKRGLPNNKVNFEIPRYQALKSKMVKRYSIIGDPISVDTDFADEFMEEMIIMPRTVKYLQTTLKPKNVVLLDRIYYLIPYLHKKSIPLRFVLGILNAKITNFWFECNYNTAKVSGNYFDLNGDQIKSIPILEYYVNNPVNNQIIDFVDKIIQCVANNDDTSIFESKLDIMLYHLYSLTYDEILIVDPETPITREEYESEM